MQVFQDFQIIFFQLCIFLFITSLYLINYTAVRVLFSSVLPTLFSALLYSIYQPQSHLHVKLWITLVSILKSRQWKDPVFSLTSMISSTSCTPWLIPDLIHWPGHVSYSAFQCFTSMWQMGSTFITSTILLIFWQENLISARGHITAMLTEIPGRGSSHATHWISPSQ